jgi:hypothetical protein
MTTEEIIKLIMETTGVKGLADLADQAKKTADALNETQKAADNLGTATNKIDAGGLMQLGQNIFSAYQTGSIENIGSIISGFGQVAEVIPLVSTFSGAIKKVGDVVTNVTPIVKEYWAAMTQPPPSKESVEALTDYAEGTDKVATATRKSVKARLEEIKTLEDLMKLESQQEKDRKEREGKEAEVRAGELQRQLGGQTTREIVEQVTRNMVRAEMESLEQEQAAVWPAGVAWGDLPIEARVRQQEIAKRIGALQRGVPPDIQADVRRVTEAAFVGGRPEDIAALLGVLPEGSPFREQIEAIVGGQARPGAKQREVQKTVAEKIASANKEQLAKMIKESEDAGATEKRVNEAQDAIRKRNAEQIAELAKLAQERGMKGADDPRLLEEALRNLRPPIQTQAQEMEARIRQIILDTQDNEERRIRVLERQQGQARDVNARSKQGNNINAGVQGG